MRRLILLLTLASLAIAQRRGVTAEDYFAFEQAGDPRIAPDGKWVAYTVTTIDQKTNRRVSRIWIAALDGTPSSGSLHRRRRVVHIAALVA